MAKPERKQPTMLEVLEGFERALEHLDYCGWGDRWERECSARLQAELPDLLQRARDLGVKQ